MIRNKRKRIGKNYDRLIARSTYYTVMLNIITKEITKKKKKRIHKKIFIITGEEKRKKKKEKKEKSELVHT